MNTITVAEIKRSGFTALDAAMQRGPVHLMKRNRPGAIVLRPEEYERILRMANPAQVGQHSSGFEMLVNVEPHALGLNAAEMDLRFAEIGEGWNAIEGNR